MTIASSTDVIALAMANQPRFRPQGQQAHPPVVQPEPKLIKDETSAAQKPVKQTVAPVWENPFAMPPDVHGDQAKLKMRKKRAADQASLLEKMKRAERLNQTP